MFGFVYYPKGLLPTHPMTECSMTTNTIDKTVAYFAAVLGACVGGFGTLTWHLIAGVGEPTISLPAATAVGGAATVLFACAIIAFVETEGMLP